MGTPEIVDLDFGPDGTMNVDLKNFHGKGCKAITDALKVMGETIKEEVKPEFHEAERSHVVNTVQARR